MNAAMLRLRLRQALPSLAAPVVAVLLAAGLCGVILAVSGHDPFSAYGEMFSFGTTEGSLLVAANKAVPLYLSAMAVAIGFKMGLFNIGVEGQYSVAIVVAAAAGAQVNLFPPLHVTFIIVVAMLSGAAWATIPAVLKVTRNVSEVAAHSTVRRVLVAHQQGLGRRARTVGGGGGKHPELAVAGGKDPSRIDDALDQARAAAGIA